MCPYCQDPQKFSVSKKTKYTSLQKCQNSQSKHPKNVITYVKHMQKHTKST